MRNTDFRVEYTFAVAVHRYGSRTSTIPAQSIWEYLPPSVQGSPRALPLPMPVYSFSVEARSARLRRPRPLPSRASPAGATTSAPTLTTMGDVVAAFNAGPGG